MRTPPQPTRRRRAARRALVSAAVLAVTAVAAAPAGAAPKAMSIERARKVYLGAVCPFNALQAERAAALDSVKATGVPLAVGSPMPAELRRTAPEYARLATRAYRTMANPPAPWPDALQPNIAIATAYSALMVQRARSFDAATIPALPPVWDTMVAVQKVNLPLLRGALDLAGGTDPCAGRTASDFTIQTVPDGTGSTGWWVTGGPS